MDTESSFLPAGDNGEHSVHDFGLFALCNRSLHKDVCQKPDHKQDQNRNRYCRGECDCCDGTGGACVACRALAFDIILADTVAIARDSSACGLAAVIKAASVCHAIAVEAFAGPDAAVALAYPLG